MDKQSGRTNITSDYILDSLSLQVYPMTPGGNPLDSAGIRELNFPQCPTQGILLSHVFSSCVGLLPVQVLPAEEKGVQLHVQRFSADSTL